jgi:hypothetical protein
MQQPSFPSHLWKKSVCLTLTYVLITSRSSAANHCTPISQICLAARHAADCNQHLIPMDSYMDLPLTKAATKRPPLESNR